MWHFGFNGSFAFWWGNNIYSGHVKCYAAILKARESLPCLVRLSNIVILILDGISVDQVAQLFTQWTQSKLILSCCYCCYYFIGTVSVYKTNAVSVQGAVQKTEVAQSLFRQFMLSWHNNDWEDENRRLWEQGVLSRWYSEWTIHSWRNLNHRMLPNSASNHWPVHLSTVDTDWQLLAKVLDRNCSVPYLEIPGIEGGISCMQSRCYTTELCSLQAFRTMILPQLSF